MLLGWQRISSRFYVSFFLCEKSRKGVGREECENSREIVKRKGVGGVSGGGENEEETSVRKVEKGVREQSKRTEWGNSREIVKNEGVDVFWRDIVERSA